MSTPAILLQIMLNDLMLSNVQVKFELAGAVFTKEGSECLGYFDQDINTLCVAIQDENWFMTFLHEYCHFQQWKEGLWSSAEDAALFSKREEWVLGKASMTDDEVLRATRSIQDCELDCEKRVVKLALTHSLPIDIMAYIKESNAYVLSYEYERLFRKPAPQGASPTTGSVMPDDFITDLATFPPGYLALMDRVPRPDGDDK